MPQLRAMTAILTLDLTGAFTATDFDGDAVALERRLDHGRRRERRSGRGGLGHGFDPGRRR